MYCCLEVTHIAQYILAHPSAFAPYSILRPSSSPHNRPLGAGNTTRGAGIRRETAWKQVWPSCAPGNMMPQILWPWILEVTYYGRDPALLLQLLLGIVMNSRQPLLESVVLASTYPGPLLWFSTNSSHFQSPLDTVCYDTTSNTWYFTRPSVYISLARPSHFLLPHYLLSLHTSSLHSGHSTCVAPHSTPSNTSLSTDPSSNRNVRY